MKFKRGDPVVFRGKHSYFKGRFLGYLEKYDWIDPESNYHPNGMTCAVQQDRTGTVFIKPLPTEENIP